MAEPGARAEGGQPPAALVSVPAAQPVDGRGQQLRHVRPHAGVAEARLAAELVRREYMTAIGPVDIL
ncbi:hypothetical protein, partial [Clavibacter michiganensis]|uniref:hypothetical protein n=1 Tax=Clavibacter michiganensis TaxID=28447 RepID=UPI00292DD4C6